MKVSDFEIDWSSGVLTCCGDHIMNNQSPCKEGDTITCDECGIEMVLTQVGNKLMWVGK